MEDSAEDGDLDGTLVGLVHALLPSQRCFSLPDAEVEKKPAGIARIKKLRFRTCAYKAGRRLG